MQIQINDVTLDVLEGALVEAGFGIVASMAPYNDKLLNWAAVWTEDGQGYECGTITKQFGPFPRYSLMLDNARIDRQRLTDLMQSIIADTTR